MLRILSVDLHLYDNNNRSWSTGKNLLLKKIEELNPHIIAFQSVRAEAGVTGGKDQALEIFEEAAGFQAHYFQPYRSDGQIAEGLAVISRLPVTDKTFFKLQGNVFSGTPTGGAIMKVTFQRPLGVFDLFNADFGPVSEAGGPGTPGFVQNARDLHVVTGNFGANGEHAHLMRQAGLVSANEKINANKALASSGSDVSIADADVFWLSPAIASELNKAEVVNAGGGQRNGGPEYSGFLLELNIRLDAN